MFAPTATIGRDPAVQVCNPVKHADFADFSFWRTSFVTGCVSPLQKALTLDGEACDTAPAQRP